MASQSSLSQARNPRSDVTSSAVLGSIAMLSRIRLMSENSLGVGMGVDSEDTDEPEERKVGQKKWGEGRGASGDVFEEAAREAV